MWSNRTNDGGSTVNVAAELTTWSGAPAITASPTVAVSAKETQVCSLSVTSLPPVDLASRRLRRRNWLASYIGKDHLPKEQVE